MRGDSRRDFYAKALALFGLGLLGAIAAVVDNWPTHNTVMTAAAQTGRTPATTSPMRLGATQFTLNTNPAHVRMSTARATRKPSGALLTPAEAPPPAVVVAERHVPPPSTSVYRGIPQEVGFVSVALADAPEAPIVFIAPAEPADYTMAAAPARMGPAGVAANDGFFSGAMRKTQGTLAKTGSTIADAFRAVGGAVGAVGGAVKRINPF